MYPLINKSRENKRQIIIESWKINKKTVVDKIKSANQNVNIRFFSYPYNTIGTID